MPGSDNGSNLANTVQTTSLTLTGPSKQLNQVCSLINVPLSPLNVGVTQWQMDKWQSYLEKMWTRVKLSTRVVSLPDPDTTVFEKTLSFPQKFNQIVLIFFLLRYRSNLWYSYLPSDLESILSASEISGELPTLTSQL